MDNFVLHFVEIGRWFVWVALAAIGFLSIVFGIASAMNIIRNFPEFKNEPRGRYKAISLTVWTILFFIAFEIIGIAALALATTLGKLWQLSVVVWNEFYS